MNEEREDNIILRTISFEDYENVLAFVARVFSENEPTCKACKVSMEDIIFTFSPMIKQCCVHRLSSCIFDTTKNEIISICLSMPFLAYNRTKLIYVSSSLIPVFNILKKLENDSYEHIDVRNSVYLFMIATDPYYNNNGLTSLLINNTYKTAKKYLYNYIVSDLTNIVSQHIFLNKHNFHVIGKAEYNENRYLRRIRDTSKALRVIKYISKAA